MNTTVKAPNNRDTQRCCSEETFKIGLFGYGCVGQGLYQLIEQLQNSGAEVVHIGVKSPAKKRNLKAAQFTFDKADILGDPSVQLIVELIDDAAEAYQIVREALMAGLKVVSANKKMVAEHLLEFINLQQIYGGSLLYEAAVCGSIPVIRTVEAYYGEEPLLRLNGIFNGSSNYILSKIFDENLNYSTALKDAQELGFAESDPTLDVGGFDARYKLSILATHGFGIVVNPELVLSLGIDTLADEDIQFARENGLELRLVATAERVGEELALFVLPHLLPEGHLLRGVENEFNAVRLEAAFSGEQFFHGKGAGSNPTASAVWADIAAARKGYSYGYRKLYDRSITELNNDLYLPVYARATNSSELKNLPWERIDATTGHSISGVIRLQALVDHQDALRQQNVFVAALGAPLIKDSSDGNLEDHHVQIEELIGASPNLTQT